MGAQFKNLIFWIGAALLIVLATVFYQPAAAKTGSLLIWMNNKVYVMDIDSLVLAPIGPAGPDEVVAPAPGCSGQTETPCWVVAGERIYQLSAERTGASQERLLPMGQTDSWQNTPVSWAPTGQHLAYTLLDTESNVAELQIYNPATDQIDLTFAGIDPTIPVAWSGACAAGLEVAGCQIAYKTAADDQVQVLAYTPATAETHTWSVPTEQIFALRWQPDGTLLYSDPPRHFNTIADNLPVYALPPGGQLANTSPNGRYTVYYQPFTLTDCQAVSEADCLHLGVWLGDRLAEENDPKLIYSLEMAQADGTGLNFIPTWSATEDAAVFFQNGELVYYDLANQEATIWYRPVEGKLRSAPIFSPNEEAVAFVDNQGQGYSEYRLVVVNPKLQPVEHIIETESGFRLLAWLPW